MRTTRLIAFVCAVLLGTSCATELKIQETVIYGQITNLEQGSTAPLLLWMNDFVSLDTNKPIEIQTTDNNGGTFHTTLEMTHKHDLGLSFGSMMSWSFLAAPGDSISVSFDAESGKINFGGDNAEFNNDYAELFSVARTNLKEAGSFNLEAPAEQLIAQIKKCYSEAKNSVDAYAQAHGMGQEVNDYVNLGMKYLIGAQLNGYRMQDGRYSPERLKLRTDDFFELDNPLSAEHSLYAYFVSGIYYDFRNSNEVLAMESTRDPSSWDADAVNDVFIEHVLTLPKSIMRDLMLVTGVRHMDMLLVGDSQYKLSERYLDEDIYYNPYFVERYVLPFTKPRL